MGFNIGKQSSGRNTVNIGGNMSNTIINGKSYSNIQGNNITISNGRVIVDGKDITDEAGESNDSNKIEITIQGSVTNLTLENNGEVAINGNVNGNVEASNSLSCGNIGGDATAGNSVNCDDVQGNVRAGNSVKCDDVGGDINAGGSVRHG